jgi:hypothetical protein
VHEAPRHGSTQQHSLPGIIKRLETLLETERDARQRLEVSPRGERERERERERASERERERVKKRDRERERKREKETKKERKKERKN